MHFFLFCYFPPTVVVSVWAHGSAAWQKLTTKLLHIATKNVASVFESISRHPRCSQVEATRFTRTMVPESTGTCVRAPLVPWYLSTLELLNYKVPKCSSTMVLEYHYMPPRYAFDIVRKMQWLLEYRYVQTLGIFTGYIEYKIVLK